MNEMKELKARAYDLIAVIETARKQLEEVNLQIQRLSHKASEESVESTEAPPN